MKTRNLQGLIHLLTIVTLFLLPTFCLAQRDMILRMEKSFPVKGEKDFEQFYLALLTGVSDEYKDVTSLSQIEDEHLYISDQKNYISWFRGDIGLNYERIDCRLWKRNNDMQVVGFYHDQHTLMEDGTEQCESFVKFYTYNEKTHCLDPINKPWTVDMSGYGHLLMDFSANGNIGYRYGDERDMGNYKILKWNTWDFRTKGTKPYEITEGQHKLKLQWIEGVASGTCQIEKDGNEGWYYIKGSHFNKDKTDWLKIEGRLKVIDSRRLYFEGIIKTRVSYLANGEVQIRRGNMDFFASGARKFWRLQQMHNPGDQCVDYVDIYF